MFDAMSKQVPRGQAHPWSTLMRPAITVAWASATTVTITPAGPGGVARIPMQNADGSLYYMGDLTAAVTLDMEVVGADGIDEGVIATATAYDIYLIAATGAVPGTMACLATVGGGAPTLPAGYTFVTRQHMPIPLQQFSARGQLLRTASNPILFLAPTVIVTLL